ncbi:hypothetical protein LJ721_004715 [Salmonella enterica]|nr:hypothetical protein [Salmonella enterica]
MSKYTVIIQRVSKQSTPIEYPDLLEAIRGSDIACCNYHGIRKELNEHGALYVLQSEDSQASSLYHIKRKNWRGEISPERQYNDDLSVYKYASQLRDEAKAEKARTRRERLAANEAERLEARRLREEEKARRQTPEYKAEMLAKRGAKIAASHEARRQAGLKRAKRRTNQPALADSNNQ